MKTIQQTAPNIFAPVEKMAQQLQSFTRQQKARLLQLVPELRTIALINAEIPPKQLELIAYFEREMDALSEGRRMQDDDMFIAGLTVAEYFALPDSEQARLWEEEHLEVERELGYYEQEVQPDALPAGVRSLSP